MSKCAACHPLRRNHSELFLEAVKSEQWRDRKKLYAFIRNPSEFMRKDPYGKKMKEMYGSMMTAFPDLRDDEIEDIMEYISKQTYN